MVQKHGNNALIKSDTEVASFSPTLKSTRESKGSKISGNKQYNYTVKVILYNNKILTNVGSPGKANWRFCKWEKVKQDATVPPHKRKTDTSEKDFQRL